MKYLSLVLLSVVYLFSALITLPTSSYSIEKQTFTVLTRGTTRPIAYFEECGRLTGFDIELLREIEKRNPFIHFEFKALGLSAAFEALDNKKGDIIANQMTKSQGREKKYIFPEEPNNYLYSRLAVREKDLSMTSIDDIVGKTVIVTSTSEVASFLQHYIKKHKMTVRVLYTDNGVDETVRAVSIGRADATPAYTFTKVSSRKDLKLNFRFVGPVLLSNPTFFILRKSPETAALAKIISTTLKEIRADGTLKSLSEKFFEEDCTNPPK